MGSKLPKFRFRLHLLPPRQRPAAADGVYTLVVLAATYGVNLVIQSQLHMQTLTPMIFVLSVFLVSLRTEGYLWGIATSLCMVLLVNYTFTAPFLAFDFLRPENLFSAVVMLLVAVMTSALTTKIKEQEKLRTESEKEKMRANLLRAISHDLRTPLTSIYGASSAVIENYDSLTKEQHIHLMKDINEDAQWLIRMVENLLSVTRIDSETVRVIKTPTVLEELIDTTLVKFRQRYPEQPVAVSIPDAFVSIPMDALLIQQVLINLLENSVLHAEGMTELTLTVRIEGGKAVFEIADNGCGIPREHLAALTAGAPVYSAPADTARHGMGIGLSVCTAIIRAHGGSSELCNRREGGTLFRFTLDMEENEDE